MSSLSFGITLVLKPFHLNGFESIDFRRRFGLDDIQSTYDCKYTQSRTECDEGFARAWFGNATWHSIEVEPSWLLPGELVANSHNRDAVQIAPDMSPERAKALYVRARLAQVEVERDQVKTDLDTLRSERDELSFTLLLAVDDRNQARFEGEQLKAEVKQLRERLWTAQDQYNDVVAIANRNERLAQEAGDQLRALQAEREIACKRLDEFKELVEAQHDLIEGMENKVAEQDELRRRCEQLRREYDAECIRVDQQEARVNRVEAGLQALIKECAQSPHAERSSA